MTEIILREMQMSDFDLYYELNKPSREYHKFNGPYFKKETEKELLERIEKFKSNIKNGLKRENTLVIAAKQTDEYIGEVSRYWRSAETKWMEIGIIICNEKYWGEGIGYQALNLWIDKTFDDYQDIVRLGLTTWSGNKAMMALSEKLGFILEARYRNARIVDEKYYDSVSYGILKEEWEQKNNS